jgi:hypothetical protein
MFLFSRQREPLHVSSKPQWETWCTCSPWTCQDPAKPQWSCQIAAHGSQRFLIPKTIQIQTIGPFSIWLPVGMSGDLLEDEVNSSSKARLLYSFQGSYQFRLKTFKGCETSVARIVSIWTEFSGTLSFFFCPVKERLPFHWLWSPCGRWWDIVLLLQHLCPKCLEFSSFPFLYYWISGFSWSHSLQYAAMHLLLWFFWYLYLAKNQNLNTGNLISVT